MSAGRVLFTASTFSHIERFHLPYVRTFAEMGWTVDVGAGGTAWRIPGAARTAALPFEKRLDALGNWRAAWMLRRMIQAGGYSLVVTHTSLASFFTRAALKGMKTRPPVVNVAHGYLFDDATPRARRYALLTAERMMAAQTDVLVTMNRYDFALARRYALGARILAVPGMGVDFARLLAEPVTAREALCRAYGIPPRSFIVLYPAEFSERKSHWVLIRAMAALPEEAVLVLAGAGARMAACRAMAAELGIERRVFFLGEVETMAQWYRAADAAASASRGEGLPFGVTEAMYMGLPVVASAVKGHVELIRHGETGLLYPYGDAAACVGALRRLMDDAALRARLGQAARVRSARYDLERVRPLVMRAYLAACGLSFA